MSGSEPEQISRREFINGWKRTATNYGLYVVRKSENEVQVFSNICTHLGCRVTWDADQTQIIIIPMRNQENIYSGWGGRYALIKGVLPEAAFGISGTRCTRTSNSRAPAWDNES